MLATITLKTIQPQRQILIFKKPGCKYSPYSNPKTSLNQSEPVLFLSECKFLVTRFEFGGSFGMSLDGDCHEVEITPYLELLFTFDMPLDEVCGELYI
jgi:hypothetical protein